MVCSFEGSSFFERRLRGRIALRVRRTGLLARQVQPLEEAGEPPLAIAGAIGSFDMLAQVSQALTPSRSGSGPRRICALSAAC